MRVCACVCVCIKEEQTTLPHTSKCTRPRDTTATRALLRQQTSHITSHLTLQLLMLLLLLLLTCCSTSQVPPSHSRSRQGRIAVCERGMRMQESVCVCFNGSVQCNLCLCTCDHVCVFQWECRSLSSCTYDHVCVCINGVFNAAYPCARVIMCAAMAPSFPSSSQALTSNSHVHAGVH